MTEENKSELTKLTLEAYRLSSMQSAIADAMQSSGNDPGEYLGAVALMGELLHLYYKKILNLTERVA